MSAAVQKREPSPVAGTGDGRNRLVQRAIGGVVLIALVLLSYFIAVPRDYYTGTNAVRTRGFLIDASQQGDKVCFPGLDIPAKSGRMEVEIDTNGQPRPAMRFALAIGGRLSSSVLPGGPGGRQKVKFAFPKTPGAPAEQRGRVCITNLGAGKVFFGGVLGVAPGEQSPTLNGQPTGVRAAIWYRPPVGSKGSILTHLPQLLERMALFRPGWVGTWTYWMIFLLIGPGLVVGALRTLLHPDKRRRIPLALLVGLIGFANAAVWAHVTPAYNSPDESEHFAYVQSLAERGKPLERIQTPRPAYSSQEALAIRMTRIFDGSETPDGKPPWAASEQRTYERLAANEDPKRDDGGGFAAAGSSHSPAYYALLEPAYFAARGGGPFAQLTATRLVSGLLGGLVAACVVLLVLEFVPERRRFAAAAGIAVAFQPMFAFMAGSVNNDMGVNAGAAVVTLLLVRLLRRGFSLPLALGLGLAVGLTPLLKATGFAVYPAVGLAVVLAVWRFRRDWRSWLPGLIVAVAAYAVVWQIWGHVAASFDRGTFGTPNGQAPGEGFPALQQKGGAFVYAWEVFFPRLPGMAEHWTQSWPAYDIFGIRGWGAFGWYALSWPHRVYWAIMAVVVALTALGPVALWRRRDWTRAHVPELLVLLTVVLGVLAVMLGAYYSPTPQGALYPEQGRYLFPAIAALAVLFVGSTFAVGRRWSEPLVAGLTTAVVCLGYASLWLMLGGFYFFAASS